MRAAGAKDIVDFWLADAMETPQAARRRHQFWYQCDPRLDEDIRTRFGHGVAAARDGELADWQHSAAGSLALVILLDQFTRNIFRGSATAYSGDEHAFQVANQAIDWGLDEEMSVVGRIFLYHPFHHREDLAAQDQGVALLCTLLSQCPGEWASYVQQSVDGFGNHRKVVAQFGRFPHRNKTLGRPNTEQEQKYLDTDPDSYGQGG